MKEIILASTSPRRRELVGQLPWPVSSMVEEVDETMDKTLCPSENVKALALKKAMAVAVKKQDCLVIGADTIVCFEGEILGKPKDVKDAARMLSMLSGKSHQVLTGVAIVQVAEGISDVFYAETTVKMAPLSEVEIDDYIASGEPMDKAGSYGIQGIASRYIEGIEGDYFNVVGLPVHALYEHLKKHS